MTDMDTWNILIVDDEKKSRIFWKCTFQVRDTVYLNFIAGRTLWIALKENTLIWQFWM